MANIKIHFNNKKYPTDKSSLAPSISQLKSHLTTVMNGSGATIGLDGESYNVDSNKLSNTSNVLASHFGTISGNGIKVLLNGVEYLLDKDKLANATLDLHTVLGLLNPTKPPEKNQYGFYFGVPYYFISPETGDRVSAAVFLEDGNVLSFGPPSYELDPGEDNTIFVASNYVQTINYDTNLVLNDGRYAMPYNYNLCGFSEDGSIMYNTYFIGDENNEDDWGDSTKYAILESEYAIAELTEREHGVYFGRTYISNAGDILIPYESNKCFTKYVNGNEYTTRLEGWQAYNHYSQEYAMRLLVNTDGTAICYGSRYDTLKFYYLLELGEQLKTPTLTVVD